jgi:hypothetical protein
MSGYVQTNKAVQLIAAGAAATYAVSAADSGKIHLIPVLGGGGANTLDITLPTLEAGLKFKFVAQGVLASDVTIAPAVAANIFVGTLLLNNGGGPPLVTGMVAKTGSANVQLTATAASGDYIELFCDGTLWASGASRIADGLA